MKTLAPRKPQMTWVGQKFVKTSGFLSILFWLSACLFSVQPGIHRPRSKFDFSKLQALANPLSKWYALPEDKCLVGLVFAFTSLNYKHQIDSNLNVFSSEIGRLPFMAGAYLDLSFQEKNLRLMLEAIHANGVVPYITFDPKIWIEPKQLSQRELERQKSFPAQIIRGDFDNKIIELAEVIKDFDNPVLLRFAHEMNGDWYTYSGKNIGGGLDLDENGQPDGPQTYISAWRHVHDIFSAKGVTKALWIFCPNGESFPKADWNRPFNYYPGSKYVDLIASDSYEAPEKFNDDLEPIMVDFFNEMGLFWESHEGDANFELRPFGLGEFGTSRISRKDKAFWFISALDYIADDRRIIFQILYNSQNKGMNFSIQGLGARLKPRYQNPRFIYSPISPK